MSKILERNRAKPDPMKRITLTMTTCKRLRLFMSTVNSFLQTCMDLEMIDEWIVVDDNSSLADRAQMQKSYPFIKYCFKPSELRGHYLSLNLLQEMVTTPYYFHLEDDWTFIKKDRYLTNSLTVLSQNEFYGQCLINRAYGENIGAAKLYTDDYLLTKTGPVVRYYVHKYIKNPEEIIDRKNNTHALWNHYSLRVGLNRTSVWKVVGAYSLSSYFESDYCRGYAESGYVTTFLDNLSCIHTGRNTSEILQPDKFNAYDLNGLPQFGIPPKILRNI